MKSRIHRSTQQKDPRKTTYFVEQLEDRSLLAASNVFAEFYGIISTTASSPPVAFSVAPANFNLSGGTVQIGFHGRALGESTVDPSSVVIRNGGGSLVPLKLAKNDVSPSGDSLAIAELASGNYQIEVAAEQGTTGAYVVELFLIGDTNGDLAVTTADINTIRQRFGAKVGDAAYMASMDADLDGRITSIDLAYAVKNTGDSTSLRIVQPRTVFWDGEAGDGQWSTARNWSGDILPTGADNVVIDVSTTVTLNGSATVGDLSLANGAIVTHAIGNTSGLSLFVIDDLLIDALSKIDVSGKGFVNQAGPGGGTRTFDTSGASGGGHGGRGGDNQFGGAVGGVTYGSIEQPASFGSGGGGEGGGFGGGIARIAVNGDLVVNGIISSNGAAGVSNAPGFGGGGAGGSILIISHNLSGTGSIQAIGGSGGDRSGAGSGGRIALYFDAVDYVGTMQAQGGPAIHYGGAGSIYIKQNSDALASLVFDNAGHAESTTDFYVPQHWHANVWVRNGAILSTSQLTTLDLTIDGNLDVEAGGYIDVSGKGYSNQAGPGGGTRTFDTSGASGGGHGGRGGDNQFGGAVGGVTYGSIEQPAAFGSGGGGEGGGFGGGIARIAVNGDLMVNGIISSNGAAGVSNAPGFGGGGAGGSIRITSHNIAGTGTIQSLGGAGGDRSGAGGGGRIALYYDASTFSGAVRANGGPAIHYGGAGSIYTKQNSAALASLIFDNAGHADATTDFYVPQHWNANVWVRNGAILSTSRLTTLDLKIDGDLNVETGGRIDVSGKGYGAGDGPGRGSRSGDTSGASGGGYGGNGGNSEFPAVGGGATYGSAEAPVDFGSGGGGEGGGTGGGAVRLDVGGTLTVDGTITSHGQGGISPGSAFGGGGSGGSIYITTATFSGAGTVSARGGDGSNRSGAGGGGRIAIYYTSNTFLGNVAADHGLIYFTHGWGLAGTVILDSLPAASMSLAVTDAVLSANAKGPDVFVAPALQRLEPQLVDYLLTRYANHSLDSAANESDPYLITGDHADRIFALAARK